MSVSLTPAGAAEVPGSAVAWLRGSALPALDGAADTVRQAVAGASEQFIGQSGEAYATHADALTSHLLGLRDRVARAADLFESYAARLEAHASLLADVRRRALAGGLQVAGDQLVAPSDPTDLVASTRWSDLATEVLHEHQALGEWVLTHLYGAVASFQGDQTARYVLDFLNTHRNTIAAGALTTAAEARQLNRLVEADRVRRQKFSGNPAVAAEGRRAIEAGEVKALTTTAGRYAELAKLPGPIGIAADTYLALESDEPSNGLMGVLGGTTGTGVAIALGATSAPVVASGLIFLGATVGGSYLASTAWGRLPDEWQESADDVISHVWDAVGEGWEAATPW